jgi:ribosomal protein L37AE/L43A
MAMNGVQFQRGLSMTAFLKDYGTEEQCERALEAMRWPEGYRCPICQGSRCSRYERGSRRYWQCSHCRHQTTVISGTIFEATKLPLTVWFLAMHLLAQSKNKVSALELKRHLGVSYPTAWAIKHKLMQVMVDRDEGVVLIPFPYSKCLKFVNNQEYKKRPTPEQ